MATEKQINLRRAVLAYIKINPEKHDQASWHNDTYDNDKYVYGNAVDDQLNVCGTTMCVAGTACFLDARAKGEKEFTPPNVVGYNSWIYQGSQLLGLEHGEATNLFLSDDKHALELLEELAAEEPNGN